MKLIINFAVCKQFMITFVITCVSIINNEFLLLISFDNRGSNFNNVFHKLFID